VSIAIRIALSPRLPEQDRAALLSSLSQVGFVHDDQARHFGPDLDWQSFVFIAHDVREIATAAVSLSALAREILRWRDRLRSGKTEPAIVLTRPEAEPIDLRTADDKALEAWIMEAKDSE
jgi:hypothetical protein